MAQRRPKRTPEELIRDLELEIQRIREAAKAKKSPARKQAHSALRSLQKAIGLAGDEDDKTFAQDLAAAGAVLEKVLGDGGAPVTTRRRRTAEDIAELEDRIVEFVTANPKCSVSQIAEALDEPSKDLRAPILTLLEENRLKKEGERRGTRYSAGRKKKR